MTGMSNEEIKDLREALEMKIGLPPFPMLLTGTAAKKMIGVKDDKLFKRFVALSSWKTTVIGNSTRYVRDDAAAAINRYIEAQASESFQKSIK